VLGEFAVRRNGEDVGLPPSRKTRALLAYLAVVGRPQRRERLCQMFWARPDDPRGALRWSLSKIRQIVNDDGRDALIADRNSVTLRSSSISADLRRVTSIGDMASLDLDELEGIARAFNGRFLRICRFRIVRSSKRGGYPTSTRSIWSGPASCAP